MKKIQCTYASLISVLQGLFYSYIIIDMTTLLMKDLYKIDDANHLRQHNYGC